MSNFSIQGTIVKIGQAANVSKTDKPFMKRELWLEIPDGNYPQTCCLEATQDRCDILDRVAEGEAVTVHFSIRGKEYNGRVFNSLNLWKIEANNGAKPGASTGNTTNTQNTPQNGANEATGQVAGEGEPPAEDGLPF
jgi:single-strand DNA-binding protein